jgi:hypothetical protein
LQPDLGRDYRLPTRSISVFDVAKRNITALRGHVEVEGEAGKSSPKPLPGA